MSEQLKQELEADTGRLETETVADSETIGEQEEKTTEGKLEDQGGNETKEEDTVPMGKASLADIVSGIPAPTKEEVEVAEAENAKPVKQKAREKLEAEKKKATQKNFAEPVITYLLKRCEEDQGLAEDVMQEGKTWNKCFSYIVEQARKQSNGRSAAVEDQVVYEWAEDYCHKYEKPEPVKKEKGKKPVITKKSVTPTKTTKKEKGKKPVITKKTVTPTKTTKKITDNEKKSQETKDKPQISEKPVKKDAASKQRKTEKISTKSSELSGQMSLFDLL